MKTASSHQEHGWNPLNVLAMTGGRNVPSARFRVRQFIEPLQRHNVHIHERYSRIGRYPPRAKSLRPLWFLAALAEQAGVAAMHPEYDVILFQRELISTFLTYERFFRGPRIMDVDDAIWTHRRGHFAARLGRLCDVVICGNTFLAAYFESHGCRTSIVPTAVDTGRFSPLVNDSDLPPIIGWSGTSGHLGELERIEPALWKVLHYYPDVRLRVICDRPPNFKKLSPVQVEFIRWTPEVETRALATVAVGLMPLTENDVSRGKCAYKMLTYMACGLPVVVSPVGMNSEVLAMGELGFAAQSQSEWVDALGSLLRDADLRRRMGETGREIVERSFSTDVIAGKLAAVLRATID